MRFLKLPIFAAAASLALWACGEEDRVTPSEAGPPEILSVSLGEGAFLRGDVAVDVRAEGAERVSLLVDGKAAAPPGPPDRDARPRVRGHEHLRGGAVCRYDAYEGSGIVSGSQDLAGTFTLPDPAPEREHLELGPGDEHRFSRIVLGTG